MSNLLVKFESFSRKMLACVEQYQVIGIGLPQEASRLQTVGGMDLDAVTSQHGGPRVARRLGAISKENFLTSKKRTATKLWWAILTTLLKRERPFLEGRISRILLPEFAHVKHQERSTNKLRVRSGAVEQTLASTCRLDGGRSLRFIYCARYPTLERMRDHLEHTFRRQTDRHVRNAEVLVEAPKDR